MATSSPSIVYTFFARMHKSSLHDLERATRPLGILRPQDFVCLPWNPVTEELAEHAMATFGYRFEQFVWYEEGPDGSGEDAGHSTRRQAPRAIAEALLKRGIVEVGDGVWWEEGGKKDEEELPIRSFTDGTSCNGLEAIAYGGRVWVRVTGEESGEDLRWRPDNSVFRPIRAHRGMQCPVLVPMYLEDAYLEAMEGLKVRIFGDHWDSAIQKSWLHPFPGEEETHYINPSTVTEPLPRSELCRSARGMGLVRGVDIPLGYSARDSDELLRAYDALKGEGVEKILLKPSDGASSGDGILFDVAREDLLRYSFEEEASIGGGVVSLEEQLDLRMIRNRRGEEVVESPVMHFLAGKTLGTGFGEEDTVGGVSQQLVSGTEFGGNEFPPPFSEDVIGRVADLGLKLQRVLGMTGFWGGDALIDKAGRVLLTDLNTARPNGAHIPRLFKMLRAPHAKVYRSWKIKIPADLTLEEFAHRLSHFDLSWDPSTGFGIAILSFVPGNKATVILLASDAAHFGELDDRYHTHVTEICISPALSRKLPTDYSSTPSPSSPFFGRDSTASTASISTPSFASSLHAEDEEEEEEEEE